MIWIEGTSASSKSRSRYRWGTGRLSSGWEQEKKSRSYEDDSLVPDVEDTQLRIHPVGSQRSVLHNRHTLPDRPLAQVDAM